MSGTGAQCFRADCGFIALGLLVTFAATSPASAQRSDDDVVASADDAFGSSVGNETVGVYNTEQVRGFSPVVAGNLRIDGLYFDLAGEPNNRLVEGSTIRVGLTAQSYPFPAPTGIVDYRLRTTGSRRVVSIVGGLADFYSPYGEIDVQFPIAGTRMGVAAGISHKNEEYADGSDARIFSRAIKLAWSPTPAISFTPFWSRLDGYGAEAQPIISVAGAYLPPELPKRKFFGQQWAQNDFHAVNFGVLTTANLGNGWTIRSGLFRSRREDDGEFTDLFRSMQPDGIAQHLIIADPAKGTASTSGEFRVTRVIVDGPRRHALRVIVRARDRQSRYGGSATFDFGSAAVDEAITLPEPVPAFSEQTNDRVRQKTVGVSYEILWSRLGEFGLGVQKTDYRKQIAQPGATSSETRDRPWLIYGNAAIHLSDNLVIFGGHTRSLEETGIAPEIAVNRGEPLPAARTRQTDAGLRYILRPGLSLVAAAFEVRKPYFNLDSNNIFGNLGVVRHRGVELSLSGPIAPRLKILAGAVLLEPRVLGEAVALGRVGSKPVGSSARRVRTIFEYSPPIVDGLSFELGIEHDGKRIVSRDNLLSLPPRTLLKAGGRYRFQIGRAPAQIRLFMENVTDSFAWKVSNSGGLRINAGRRLTGYLAVDL